MEVILVLRNNFYGSKSYVTQLSQGLTVDEKSAPLHGTGYLFKVLKASRPAYDVLSPLGNAGQTQQEAEAAQQCGQYRLQY
jgi:hypothetical protein